MFQLGEWVVANSSLMFFNGVQALVHSLEFFLSYCSWLVIGHLEVVQGNMVGGCLPKKNGREAAT